MDDAALSSELTSAIRAVPGVVAVYPPRPIVHGAAEAVAAALALREPDVLVDIDRHGTTVRIAAGIAVSGDRPAPDTVREVGERVRDLVDQRVDGGADLVTVTIRLVEDAVTPGATI
ncbi:hypothetical protein ABC270_16330 [Curtobacterium sp. 1P10AnD]|uniref:hypothetical protein n=1 Tax=Curtobacterium sp. 1P10AnD TaxID=3132283 RepID=UPI0039A1DE32